MKIALDLDGVIADSYPFFDKWCASKNYGHRDDIEFNKFLEHWWEFTESPEHIDIPVMEGALTALNHLNHFNELYIVTSRHPKTEQKTVEWLDKRIGNMFEKVYLNTFDENDSKVKPLKEIPADIFLDDSKGHIDITTEGGIESVLFTTWKGIPELFEARGFIIKANNSDNFPTHYKNRYMRRYDNLKQVYNNDSTIN